jgi:hypothetical protein
MTILSEAVSITTLTIRFLVYPFIIYTLISMAISLESWKSKRVVALHVSVTIVFMALWIMNIAKLMGYPGDLPFINDYVFTIALILVAVLSWRRMFKEERLRLINFCKNKEVRNG